MLHLSVTKPSSSYKKADFSYNHKKEQANMSFKSVREILATIFPFFLKKKSTRHRYNKYKYNEKQIQEIVFMWRNWQKEPSLYRTQDNFANMVNLKFNTNKATVTIIRLARKYEGKYEGI